AYDEFYNAAKPLADWKKKSGYDVELVKYSEVASNSNDLKAYFQKKYDNGDLCFVTLVGEYEHIPTMKGKCEGANSDNMYMKLAGDDNIPDAFISRLSAKNIEDVQIQVNKTLEYEINPADGSWATEALGIASNEGNPKDYIRVDELHTSLKNKLGFTKIWECYAPDAGSGGWYWKDENSMDSEYPGVPGTMPPMMFKSARFDSSNNTSDKSVIFDAVNSGVSIINYVGHGSDYTWVTSGFSTSDAHKLNNTGKYPIIWDVACVNGALHRDECFAEAWMRTGTPEKPAGAIGIVAGSTNEAWVPPCDWQAEIIHNQLGEKKNSIGNVVNMYGLLKVAEMYGASDRSEGNRLIEQKIYFGEGTVSLRTEKPKKINAEAIIVDNTILVAVDGDVREGLTVTAYDNNVERTYSAKTDTRGMIEIPYEGQTMITVTGLNAIPVVDLVIEK
ncbi:MAG: C25 family cysteine peptidase, partial [Candidatus Muirbacterium halophilum]|nr:C25 family cysteine peptidase [Candidatus Muirbacterium halophilum]